MVGHISWVLSEEPVWNNQGCSNGFLVRIGIKTGFSHHRLVRTGIKTDHQHDRFIQLKK